ncbi:type IV pilus modification PilV family protein [Melittangium boletus]|jgi:prepilin-type N-terminal cleavage/methylation domain-containing protein|uniref:type IV pilus modification PilV family protein n=1 Tax=Melittangium boletus TaxID=83453 RepID=UPI003DA4E5FF
MARRTAPRGLTLVEVMVAMVIIAVATLALVSANTIAARYSSRSYRHYVAMRLAQQRLEVLVMGDQKQKLRTAAAAAAPVVDSAPQDCQESGSPAVLCTDANLMGWVDIYGRPCRRTGKPEQGYHPTCQYRRYVRYTQEVSGNTNIGDTWRVTVAVSHATDGVCGNFLEGNSQCVVTSAVLTR